MPADRSILDITLAAARRDAQTATPGSQPLRRMIHGVVLRPLVTHADDRGSVMEIFDPRWQISPDPVVFVYTFMIRAGMAKGWNLHREHEDRYALLQGEMALVLFDPRPDSPTCGEVSRLVLSEAHRMLVTIPRNVWHADHNIGTTDVVVVNMPTAPYNHENPDKYRLPLDTDLIPYSFGAVKGW